MEVNGTLGGIAVSAFPLLLALIALVLAYFKLPAFKKLIDGVFDKISRMEKHEQLKMIIVFFATIVFNKTMMFHFDLPFWCVQVAFFNLGLAIVYLASYRYDECIKGENDRRKVDIVHMGQKGLNELIPNRTERRMAQNKNQHDWDAGRIWVRERYFQRAISSNVMISALAILSLVSMTDFGQKNLQAIESGWENTWNTLALDNEFYSQTSEKVDEKKHQEAKEFLEKEAGLVFQEE